MTLQELLRQESLRAIAAFRREAQPEWFAHIHPHGHATARLARCFAAACGKGVGRATLDEIELGARLHDIGKYLISRAILFKPGLLDEEERAIMSLHPVHGARILYDLPLITTPITQIVLYHHERWDGMGYPEGLAGSAIPLAARLVAIADVYTALRARRSYKPTLTRDAAYATLERMAGYELDPNLVEDFLRFVGRQVKAGSV